MYKYLEKDLTYFPSYCLPSNVPLQTGKFTPEGTIRTPVWEPMA